MTASERRCLIDRYASGPTLLKQALSHVPSAAMTWRPAAGKWSVHEVVCHCADSETNSAMRIRYLFAEREPTIAGYDQDEWASALDYHSLPLDLALAQIETVRRWTADLIRRAPEEAWSRSGTHTEMAGERYTAERWLQIYGEHLEIHARQILRNVSEFQANRGGSANS